VSIPIDAVSVLGCFALTSFSVSFVSDAPHRAELRPSTHFGNVRGHRLTGSYRERGAVPVQTRGDSGVLAWRRDAAPD